MRSLAFILLFLSSALILALTIDMVQVTEGPPPCYEIRVINDSEPPVEITDFHFSVTMPGQISPEVALPPGWELRYALPNSFLEADATPGSEIPSGGEGNFLVCIEGPIEDLAYTLYFTSRDGVIPGSDREGPLGPLGIKESPMDSPEFLRVSPNPFRKRCNIEISDGWNIDIIDQQGKLIKNLGTGSVTWTPDDDIADGVYFMRATKGEYKICRKLIIIK